MLSMSWLQGEVWLLVPDVTDASLLIIMFEENWTKWPVFSSWWFCITVWILPSSRERKLFALQPNMPGGLTCSHLVTIGPVFIGHLLSFYLTSDSEQEYLNQICNVCKHDLCTWARSENTYKHSCDMRQSLESQGDSWTSVGFRGSDCTEKENRGKYKRRGSFRPDSENWLVNVGHRRWTMSNNKLM